MSSCRRQHLDSTPSPIDWLPVRNTERCRRLYTDGYSNQDSSGAALSTSESDKPCTASPRKEKTSASKERPCPHCAKPMACIVDEHRPSWREVFDGPYHPEWFEWVTTGNFPLDEPPDKVDGESVDLGNAASGLADKRDIFEELDTLLEEARE